MNRSFQITARQLVKFNEWAHREKQNRVLNIEDRFSKPETMPLKVDKTKLVVCQPILLHTNHAGVVSWRCLVVFGVEGQAEPESSLLDVPLKFRREILQKPIQEDGSIGEPKTEHAVIGQSYGVEEDAKSTASGESASSE